MAVRPSSIETLVDANNNVPVALGSTAALADGAANPTSSTVNADVSIFNGTTWDRMRSSSIGTGIAVAAAPDYSFVYISTAATTTVKSGAGFFHLMMVSGGTAGTVIIYDNTAGSGSIIASFDSTNAINTYGFNVKFATGLTIVTSAATKITVTYR